METQTLVNGQYSASVEIADRGLAYGDGLFETIKVANGRPEFLGQHLQRLSKGCQQLDINCNREDIERDIDTLLSGYHAGTAVLKLIVSRGQAGQGYRPDHRVSANRYLTLQGCDQLGYECRSRGVTTRLCDTRLAINPALAGLKHLSRLENVLAASEWNNPEIAEGLLLDTAGRLVEGTRSNLFLVVAGKLLTPSLHRCGVEGVIRNIIVDHLAPELGLDCNIADLTVADIYQADEMFLCNSLIGIWPVAAVGCHRKAVGPVTKTIDQALENARKRWQ